MAYQCNWLSILFLFFLFVGVHAETDELQAEAYRTYQSVEIDGELTEPDWQKATPIHQFIQFEPDAGAALSVLLRNRAAQMGMFTMSGAGVVGKYMSFSGLIPGVGSLLIAKCFGNSG